MTNLSILLSISRLFLASCSLKGTALIESLGFKEASFVVSS